MRRVQRITARGFVLLSLLGFAACASALQTQEHGQAASRPDLGSEDQVSACAQYFTSPAEAVPAIAALLRADRWAELSCYYDLSGSSFSRAELESGRYFLQVDDDRPRHPGGLSRIRQPFSPGFRYVSHQQHGEDAVVQIEIEIDQGGGMVQRGMQRFVMRHSKRGWRIRPEVVSIDLTDTPH